MARRDMDKKRTYSRNYEREKRLALKLKDEELKRMAPEDLVRYIKDKYKI